MKYTVKKNLHTDFSVFEENKLPARSYFIPFSDIETLNGTDYKSERYKSDRITMLSGEWDFKYYEKLSRLDDEIDTTRMNFDSVTVPSTWQRTGYDQIAYINTRYPFPKKPPHIPYDIPTAVYRKSFNKDKISSKEILTFLGVAGALSVYLNGKYIGYSEGSHNTAEFDISDDIKSGENELVCVVFKWSNGTYLECQDMFRENGIFRDVYITSLEENHIRDFFFSPKKNKDGTYNLDIKIDAELSKNAKIILTAADNAQKQLFEVKAQEAQLKYLAVDEWSAEMPNVYTVYLTIYDNDKICETVRTYIGFKDASVDGEVFRFNGKPIKIKGVNHHDTHMTKGYAMGLEDLEKDIVLMKEFNCNAVRTSHYPPDPAFITMCDLYGLYVIDEADIETHGFYAIPHSTYNPNRLSNDLKWASHYLDRVKRMFERDKNHPSITMWSLGNESGGYKCQDVCCDFLKKVNPEIPVHYEGVIRSKRWAYDVVSHMYATPDLMRKISEDKGGKKYEGKPFFQCEYAHAMGNGPGGLEDYMKLFLSDRQFMGGCIWEWADHSIYDENAKYKWTYGGDHNEPIHDGNFCVDGLFFPDRTPSSGALEMKAVYRPIRAEYLGNGKISLWNTEYFKDASDIDINWSLTENGEELKCGRLDINIEPQEKCQFVIDEIRSAADKDEDIFVDIIYTRKDNGFLIAREQLIISEKNPKASIARSCAKISEKDNKITVSYKNGNAVFDKAQGLISYTKGGTDFINAKPVDKLTGFVPHIFRGNIDNDRNLMIYWNINGIAKAKPALKACKIITVNDREAIRTKYLFTANGIVIAKSNVDYVFDENGDALVNVSLNQISPLPVILPRFGVHIELPESFEKVRYFGRGEEENYSDFKEHTHIGVFETTVSRMGHKYIKPQDSGNRGDVRWSEIESDGSSIKFSAADKHFSFNSNHFTLGQLMKARHIEDIPDAATTFTAIDGYVRGSGSASCGPAPGKAHTIDFGLGKGLHFSFKIEING